MHKHTIQLEGSGGIYPPENFRGYEIASLGQCDASWRLDDRTSHVQMATLSAHRVVQHLASSYSSWRWNVSLLAKVNKNANLGYSHDRG